MSMKPFYYEAMELLNVASTIHWVLAPVKIFMLIWQYRSQMNQYGTKLIVVKE